MVQFLLLLSLLLGPLDWLSTYTTVLNAHTIRLQTSDALCTGVVVGKSEVLTAAHCVEDEGFAIDQFKVNTIFTVEKRSKGFDLALLKVVTPTKSPIALTTSDPLPGQPVMGIGFTEVLNQVEVGKAPGEVSVLEDGLVVTTCHLYPGYSGGPLVNTIGQLVGINIATNEAHTKGYAVPITTIRYFLEHVK